MPCAPPRNSIGFGEIHRDMACVLANSEPRGPWCWWSRWRSAQGIVCQHCRCVRRVWFAKNYAEAEDHIWPEAFAPASLAAITESKAPGTRINQHCHLAARQGLKRRLYHAITYSHYTPKPLAMRAALRVVVRVVFCSIVIFVAHFLAFCAEVFLIVLVRRNLDRYCSTISNPYPSRPITFLGLLVGNRMRRTPRSH